MNECMYFSTRLLEAIGVFETGNKSSLSSLKTLVFISLMLFFIASLVNELFHISNDLSHFNDILVMVLFGVITLAQYTALLYNRKRMTDLKSEINADMINGEKSKSDDMIIEHHDREGLTFAKTVASLLCCCGVTLFLQNLAEIFFGDELILPFIVSYPFSLNSTGVFVLIYAQQFVCCYTYIITCAATDAWIIFLTYHACGHFSVLQKYLEQVADDEHWVEYRPMDACQRIAKCVRLHQNICRMTDDIEDFFTVPNFIHFLVSAVGICSSAYELSSSYTEMTQWSKHATAIGGHFALLFVVNRCGQLIQDKSFGVSLAVYRSSFYKFKACHRRDMAFMMLRSQKPICLTACNFCILSLKSMANVLKASVTYFGMFRKFDQKLQTP